MSSANVGRAYKNFLREYDKRTASAMSATNSTTRKGLLAPRGERKANPQPAPLDKMNTLVDIVREIRKYGGKKDGQ